MKRSTRLEQLQELFNREHQRLYITAMAITRRRACAEDAVHDALLAVAEVKSEVNNIRFYLYRAVRNRALHLVKQQARHSALESDNELLGSDSTSLEHSELARQVNKHIAELDSKYQQVLIMKLFSDLTFEEIATITDNPLNTVASWYRRGLTQLKERIHAPEPIARLN